MKTKLNIFNFSPMLHKGWRESAKVQKCNVALLHYCRIAQSRTANHFVRFAAMFLMLMTLSVGQVWGANFTKGSTIYLDLNSKGWASGADIVAIFYYADNTSWCYETNSAYTPKNDLSSAEATTHVDGDIYSVTVPNADVKEMYFIRKQSSSNTVWNYSAKMSADNMGSNNCVKLNDWDNNSSWATYDNTPKSYYLKHPWGGGEWSWIKLNDEDSDGIWTVDAAYGGAGCNWRYGESGSENWIGSPTLVGNPASGDECTFAFNSANKTITITKIPTCTAGAPSVSWTGTPTNGKVGDSFDLSTILTYTGGSEVTLQAWDIVGGRETDAVTFDGLTAHYNAVINPVAIKAYVTNAAYCTPQSETVQTPGNFMIEAACITGAPTIAWATAPANGAVGDNKTASVTADGTVAWTSSNTAVADVDNSGVITYKTEGDATIRATVTNASYCTPTAYVEQAIRVSAAPCVPTTYELKHTTHGFIATFTPTTANEYDLTFKVNNDIINGLYVVDNCGNRYGCSTAIRPGQSITLTTEPNTFNFEGAAQNNTWHYTFNSETKLLSCDAQSEEEKAAQTYLIQFFNYNGTSLQSGRVEEGKTPVYNGATPTRASDAEWDYTFDRWEPALYAADKDQNYSAIYTQTRREYTLTWDFAGGATTTPEAEYTHGSVANGAAITAPANPTKSGAVFTGWSPDVAGTMPTANTTYTAQWKTLQNIYVVGRFTIDDGAGNLTYTGGSDRDWNGSSKNIKFTYDEGTGYYKLETHRSVAQLASGESGDKYYFHFMEGSTNYGAGGTNVAPGLVENKKNVAVSNSDNFVFSTSDNAAADDVVLWIDWNAEPKKFWYSATDEQTYTVTINNGDHGTVTPNGEQQVGKSGISITATPDDGYSFASWSVTGTTANVSIADVSAASTTITASGTGATVTATWAALIPSVTLSVDHSTRSVGQTATLTVAIENWKQLVCFEVEKDGVASDMVLTDNSNNTFTTPALEVGVYRFRAHLKSACDGESRANSDWKTVTVTEDLSCNGWYFKTEMDGWKKHDFQKEPGHTDVNIGYYTLTVSTPDTYKAGVQNDRYYKNNGTYTRGNNNQWWTMDGNSGDWQFTADVAGNYVFAIDYSEATPKVKITYPTEAANAYYIYLGQTYDLPAAYTWASVNGGLPIVGNTATGKELGHYTVTRTDAGGHSVDVDVYVYQYYVKHQWNYAGGGTTAETNAAWVWRPMTLVGGTLTYTGTISNDNKGGNLCWDYTYDWTGVYQLDDDGTHNFHPGLDNNDKMGYWGNGAHQYEAGMPEATTGATTWKADWASELTAGQVADFTYVPTTPYNGTEEPTVQGGDYGCTAHVDEDICTVTFGSKSYNMDGTYNSSWTGADAKGSVTTNLGSTSGLKVIKGTKATFMATPADGFLFMGWYAAADCSGEVVSENATYSVILSSESYELYAKFQQEPTFKLYFTSVGSDYDMTNLGNGEFYFQINKHWGENEEFYVKFGSQEWTNASMNHCQGTKVSNPGAVGRPIVGFGAEGDYTLTVNITYYGEGQNIDICVNAEPVYNSGWYLCGDDFGAWNTTNTSYPFNMSYRGFENQYYREVTFNASAAKYFRVHNRSIQYSGNSSADTEITAMGDKKNLVEDSNKAFKYTPTKDKVYWFVVKTNDTKQFWIQEPAHYVNVTNIRNGGDEESTYTLKTTDGLATTMYNNGELYVLRITPKAGLQPLVTVDGVAEELVANQDGTYTYTGSMQDKDQNVVITYEALKPITIYVRNDAKEGGFAQSGCRPLLQYKVGGDAWVQYGETTPMIGFQNWFTITLPEAFAQNVTIQFCAGKTEGTWWNGEYDWSTQVELSSAISKYCLSIDNYKETSYKEMRLSTAECPEFNVELTVSGGEQIGAVATLKASAKITEDETHKVNLNYYVSYDGAEYELINNSPLVGINKTQGYTITRAGTYKYKVVATFDDGTQTWEAEAVSKTYTIEAVTLVMIPSANYVAKNTSLTLTPEITGLASNVNVTYSYSFSAAGLSVDDAAVVPATINVGDVTNGTYTIYTTLKMGDVAIASHACNIEVGNITVTLTHDPSSGVMASTVLTLTATTSGIDGDKTYSFTVKAATEAVPVTLATAQASNSIQYTVPAEDTYTFTVVVSDGINAYKATDEVVVAAKDYYISYTSWSGYQKMNYCGNGVYTYYYAGATKYRTSTNTASINTQSNGTGAHNVTAIEHPSDDNIDAIFSYNANRDELTILPATTVMYRVKSVTENGTFYSNEVAANGKVSFYATPSATLTWQTYSKEHIDAWQDLATPIATAAFKEDNVYVAYATVGATPALSDVEVYDGTYYIYSHMTSLYQTDIATVETDGYDKHKQYQASMTRFENLNDDEFYNHYWVEWVDVQWGNDGSYTDISRDAYATVGNTINRCVSRILPSYTLPYGTNLRYGYSPKTNHFSRAFLKGAGDDFLQMFGYNIFDTETGSTAISNPSNALTLSDGSGWVYMGRVKCATPAEMKLISNYNNQTTYLLSATGSSATTRKLLGSTTTMEGKLDFMVIYDYKTNRIVTGWVPGDKDIDGTVIVDADILFIRQEQGKVAQLTMHDDEATISSLQRVMFVLELDRDVKPNQEVQYEISMPFDCKLSDVFGVVGYMDVWGIQRYDGTTRAKYGWKHNNWTWLDESETLKKGEGYSLSFDKERAAQLGLWREINGKAYLRLYFPSTEKGFYMSQSTVEPPITYPNEPCNVGSEFEKRRDSNWKMIGMLGYTDVEISAMHIDEDAYLPEEITQEAPNFYYVYDENYYSGATGHYRAEDASRRGYDAFSSYFVQFAGTINWSLYTKSEQEVSPAMLAIRARAPKTNNSFSRTTMEFHLNNVKGEEVDRTFIYLRKGATEGYDQNLDLVKITDNGGTRISTVSDGSEYVANALPVETDTVSVLLNITANGSYSIAMKNINPYVEPILWDSEMNTYTPMNLTDYEVDLTTGLYEHRFYMLLKSKEISDATTSLEGVQVDNLNLPAENGTRKLMINGMLYLLRDGQLYDATGHNLK